MPAPDLDADLAGLTEPENLSLSFNKLVHELGSKVSEPVIMAYAISLLDGDDPGRYPTALRHMGGAHADLLLSTDDLALWPRVWGARALQYVWTPHQAAQASRLVVRQLGDERWRVAEMCTKVVGRRELAEGADALLRLTGHRLPRVRMQAVRALGKVGETEHLAAIREALADDDTEVRRAAGTAMELCADRLDLDVDALFDPGGRRF